MESKEKVIKLSSNDDYHAGEILRKLLHDHRITNVEASKILGISKETVSRIMGRKTFDVWYILLICRSLQVSPLIFFPGWESGSDKEIESLRDEINLLKKLNSTLEENNLLLKEKINGE